MNEIKQDAKAVLADNTAEIVKAAERLVRCKGRYHSEQNMIALAELFGVKLPPSSAPQAALSAPPAAEVEKVEEWHPLQRELNAREKAILAPPHPGDFGIPKEHWEAAKHYANYWAANRVLATPPAEPAQADGGEAKP